MQTTCELLPPKPWQKFTKHRQHVGRTGDLGLSGNSFSFMCWVKLHNTNSSGRDRTILAQAAIGRGECLHITVRNMKPYFGFYDYDTASETELSLHMWYHLAFVYDVGARTQTIYVNGIMDARSKVLIPPLRGNHDVYYSYYNCGRPLMGLLAAPLLLPRHVASQAEISRHMNPQNGSVPAAPGIIATPMSHGIAAVESQSPLTDWTSIPNPVELIVQELAEFICAHDQSACFVLMLQREYAAAKFRSDYSAVAALGRAVDALDAARDTPVERGAVAVTELCSRYAALMTQLSAQCEQLTRERNFEGLTEVAAQLTMLKALDISVLMSRILTCK
jgi:hypothetical protein